MWTWTVVWYGLHSNLDFDRNIFSHIYSYHLIDFQILYVSVFGCDTGKSIINNACAWVRANIYTILLQICSIKVDTIYSMINGNQVMYIIDAILCGKWWFVDEEIGWFYQFIITNIVWPYAHVKQYGSYRQYMVVAHNAFKRLNNTRIILDIIMSHYLCRVDTWRLTYR